MIKMIIKMDENRINNNPEYTVEKVYSAIDRIFTQRGMDRIDTNSGIEYCGHEKPTDFAYFGKIMLGLKNQAWFMDNVTKWILCNSDDEDDPNDFSEEDLLAHYRGKAFARG